MSIASLYPSINPSLLLDFANSKVLDSRVTFTRTTTATYYDGVTTAKAEENLLTYSQEFDNAAWGKTNITVTANSVAAPDGTTTADTVTQSAGTGSKLIYQAITGSAGKSYAVSVYAKAGTNNYIQLLFGGSNTDFANFDLSGAGAVGTVSGFTSGTTATITSVGNSWFRCVVSWSSLGVDFTFVDVCLIPSSTSARAATTADTNTVYLWGIQMEQRSSATAYTATTTQAITNYIPVLQTAAAGQARFDHNPTTGESLGLLIEEARTNLVTYSEQFDNAAWSKSQVSVYANDAVAPNGTVTADRIVESTANNVHDVTQVVSISGAVHTISCYLKCINTSRPRAALVCYDGGAGTTRINIVFDLAAGTIVQSGHGTGTITSVGNGWYRCTATSSVALVSNASVSIRNVNNSNNEIYAGDGWSGVFAWGCQFEQASFATSYIPTVASSVTRNADAASMTGTNFSSWFNNANMSAYIEAVTNAPPASTNTTGFSLNNGTLDRTNFFQSGGGSLGLPRAWFLLVNNGAAVVNLSGSGTTVTQSVMAKSALAIKTNDFAFTLNSATVLTQTSGIGSAPTQMNIGADYNASAYLNGTIKKLAYYPTRVTNTQLQSLTV